MNSFIVLLLLVSVSLSWAEFETADDAIKYLQNHVKALTRQTMLQQFFAEQRVRSEGQSGLKLIRQRKGGTKNYFVETHTGYSAAAIHDHSNNIRTVGMGEFTAVLNGIEFRTRHNDYSLRMPHKTSAAYHATEPVPFPEVPPEVTIKATLQEQIDEMREWFKAWKTQNYSKRDYRKYFKPNLCYLEGSWTTSGDDIDEPFTSDRHFVDAKTWMELHDKARFVAYTGTKSLLENLSFLPTKIIGLKNETIPEFAQWNYRILCHPIKRDIPLNRLRVVEDLSSRMMTTNNIYRHQNSRAARFQFNSKDSKYFFDRPSQVELLDEIMQDIPGKDNYQGKLYDEGLDTQVMNDDKTQKDVSRYHRWYRIAGRDAMGTAKIHRGYSDHYLFAAMTTQPKVAGVGFNKCKITRVGKKRVKNCYPLKQKWSYAIPLELIYLTPLSSWNPYNLTYHGEHRLGRSIANKDGRYGDCKNGSELNGLTSKYYYMTPKEFYSGGHVGRSSADTTRGVTCVLDQDGVSREVRAAGTHVFLPNIKNVGVLRQRYPIFPVHGEGSSVWKELNALQEIVMKNLNYMKWSSTQARYSNVSEFEMSSSNTRSTSKHTHEISVTTEELLQLKSGAKLNKISTTANNHQHELQIWWHQTKQEIWYSRCDNKFNCWDRHGKVLFPVNN